MPTKADRNDGAVHAEPDAESLETESDADAEQKFDESTGKKRKYNPYLKYTEVKRWITGEDSILEPAEIKREIYMLMKKFMQDSRLMKAPPLRDTRRLTLISPIGSCTVPNITTRDKSGSERTSAR